MSYPKKLQATPNIYDASQRRAPVRREPVNIYDAGQTRDPKKLRPACIPSRFTPGATPALPDPW